MKRLLLIAGCALTLFLRSAPAEQGLVTVRRRIEATYLTPHLAVLRVVTRERASHTLIHFQGNDLTDYRVIAKLRGQGRLQFSWRGEFQGYVRAGQNGKHRLSVLDDQGKLVRTITFDSRATLLGSAGYVIFPVGSELSVETRGPVDLKFYDNEGNLLRKFSRPGWAIFHRAVADDGSLALIVGPWEAKAENRFLRFSSLGVLEQEVPIKRCIGGSSTPYLIVSEKHAAFACFPGTGGRPVFDPKERLLRVISRDKRSASSRLPKDCSTRPVWFGDDAIALFGRKTVRIWDLRTRKWRDNKLVFSGRTFLGECVVTKGVVTTLVLKKGKYWIEAVDIDTGRLLTSVALPAGTTVGPAKVLHQKDDAVIVLTPEQLYEVHPQRK